MMVKERGGMRTRWAVATAAALALALLTLHLPSLQELAEAAGAAPPSCPADAKAANLNFTMKDLAGKNVRLSEYKGKVILLDFWATWCVPCKAEIPWFVEFQQQYGPQGLQVVGVSVDDTLQKMKPYVAQLKMNYTILQGLGHDDVQDAYGPMYAIPVTAVISRDQKICAKHTGIASKAAIESEIKALLHPAAAL
jgi:thiol-disulfide isomerase/thioredoxin